MTDNLTASLGNKSSIDIFVRFDPVFGDLKIKQYKEFITDLVAYQLDYPNLYLYFNKDTHVGFATKPYITIYFNYFWPKEEATREASRLRTLFTDEYDIDFIYEEKLVYD